MSWTALRTETGNLSPPAMTTYCFLQVDARVAEYRRLVARNVENLK